MKKKHALRSSTVLALLTSLAACGDGGPALTVPTAPAPVSAKKTGGSGGGYEVMDLGGTESTAFALNGRGVVVGATGAEPDRRASYWTVDDAGAVTGPAELGLPGPAESGALDVNDAGHVIAREIGSGTRSFIYDVTTGDLVELSHPDGALGVAAWSLNGDDLVAGSAYFEEDGGTVGRPVLWRSPFDPSAAPELLPVPEGVGSCGRVYVNDPGVIAGFFCSENAGCSQLRWEVAADGTVGEPAPFGEPGFQAFGINDAGRLAGVLSGWNATVQEANGGVTGLDPVAGDPQAGARALNDPLDGQPLLVAGTSDIWGEDEKAVVWSVGADGVVSDPVVLPDGKHGTSRANSVNADGWVAGEITDTRWGTRTATLWLPTSDDGGSDDDGGGDGGDCVPKGPNGNNCK